MNKKVAPKRPNKKESETFSDGFSYIGLFFGSTACISGAFLCAGIAAMITLGFSDFGALMQATIFTVICLVIMLLCLFVLYLKYARKNKQPNQPPRTRAAPVARKAISAPQQQQTQIAPGITLTTNVPPAAKKKGKP